MAKQATFSNGTVDTYKGKRDVKAAWAIFMNGDVVASGHSLDRAKARKTAETKAPEVMMANISEDQKAAMTPFTYSPAQVKGTGREFVAKVAKEAKALGFASHKEQYDAYRADIAKAVQEHVTIEIVDI